MRKFLLSMLAVVFVGPAYAQNTSDDLASLKQQLDAIQAKIDLLTKPNPFLTYDAGAEQAYRNGKPLVTYLGCTPRVISGAVVCQSEAITGYSAPAIIISVPGDDWLVLRAVLSANASDAQIQQAMKPRQVQTSMSVPFAEPEGNLPEAVALLLTGMQNYTPTKVAQVSGNRSGGGANWVVSRLSIPSKWQQPGGLEGLTGWSNKLYRKSNNPVRNWMGHVNDWEHYGGTWGSEITYQRSYGEGAKFADVLSTPTGVFEVRVAEKIGGEWRRSIPYRDKTAEPANYVRVSLTKCAECHDQAGDGGYGTARIIGGDGVLSDPFPALEGGLR